MEEDKKREVTFPYAEVKSALKDFRSVEQVDYFLQDEVREAWRDFLVDEEWDGTHGYYFVESQMPKGYWDYLYRLSLTMKEKDAGNISRVFELAFALNSAYSLKFRMPNNDITPEVISERTPEVLYESEWSELWKESLPQHLPFADEPQIPGWATYLIRLSTPQLLYFSGERSAHHDLESGAEKPSGIKAWPAATAASMMPGSTERPYDYLPFYLVRALASLTVFIPDPLKGYNAEEEIFALRQKAFEAKPEHEQAAAINPATPFVLDTVLPETEEKESAADIASAVLSEEDDFLDLSSLTDEDFAAFFDSFREDADDDDEDGERPSREDVFELVQKLRKETTFPFHTVNTQIWRMNGPEIDAIWQPLWGDFLSPDSEDDEDIPEDEVSYSANFNIAPRVLDYLYRVALTLDSETRSNLSAVFLAAQSVWEYLRPRELFKDITDDLPILSEDPPEYRAEWEELWSDFIVYMDEDRLHEHPFIDLTFLPAQLAHLATITKNILADPGTTEEMREVYSSLSSAVYAILFDLAATLPDPVVDFPKLDEEAD